MDLRYVFVYFIVWIKIEVNIFYRRKFLIF